MSSVIENYFYKNENKETFLMKNVDFPSFNDNNEHYNKYEINLWTIGH